MRIKQPLELNLQDEGVAQGLVDTLNFTGAGVTASRSGAVGTVNIPGGGAGAAPDVQEDGVLRQAAANPIDYRTGLDVVADGVGGVDISVDLSELSHATLGGVTSDQHHAQLHQAAHQSGGGDALSGNLDANGRLAVRRNTGVNVGTRRRLNLIEGANITLTVADDGVDEEVDVTIAAAGGGGAAVAEGRAKSATETMYTVPGVSFVSQTTAVLAASQDRFFPMYIVTAVTLDLLSIQVTVAGAAATTARLGIYNANTDWQPTTLVLDAGTVAVDSTGIKSITINQALSAGRYLLVINTDGAPTVRGFRGTGRYTGLIPTLGANAYVETIRNSRAYAVFPSPGTAWDTSVNNSVPLLNVVLTRVSTP